ncbi:MAG: T9SS type A sorting domain-containing protein [Muribaculaceae bacterium]|nr:T9SS type A sorting domain-containing protein [Muribaculaceae bacterium]
MKTSKYRLKTLSAVALFAAAALSSHARIADNPVIIPQYSDEKGFINEAFDFGNTTTFYIIDENVVNSAGVWDYTVRLFGKDFAPVRSFSVDVKRVDDGQGYGFGCNPEDLDFYNARGYEWSVRFTKTLFNTDDKVEYVVMDEDQFFSPAGDHQVFFRGIKIMSEDGTLIQKITLPEGYYISAGADLGVYQSNGLYYLGFMARDGFDFECERVLMLYRIDREAGSVSYVTAMPAKMSVRSGDGVVTVDLPADAGYSAVELVDMSGRVMGGVPVSGDKVSVDTSRLAKGTYVLRAAGASGSECAKIVVR